MGVKNFQIEGVSCAGKTTVCKELQRRGHQVIHGDDELAYWGDPETGEPLDSSAYEHWIWDVAKVRAIVADRQHELSFLCGGARNAARFVARLDGVFVLQVDRRTLDERLEARPDDEWSGSPSVGATAARREHARQELPEGAIPIDATAPVAAVADAILAIAAGS